MKLPSAKDAICPFSPKAFPPRPLKKKQLSALLKKADLALAEYAQTLSLLPHPRELLAPLAILEAIASLNSQKIKTTLKAYLLNRALPSAQTTKKLSPIEDYLKGIAWLQKHRDPFHKKAFCTLHKIIKAATSPPRDLGKYRNRQNWIGPIHCTIEEAYFYPPAAEKVEPLMQELFDYAAKQKEEPLLQLAMIFAQLLIIHPFMDGNGRIARILIPEFLCSNKVLPSPHFYLSAYFKKHRLKYFRTLYKTTDVDNWEDWIVFFLKGVLTGSLQQKKMVTKIASLYDRMDRELPSLNNKTRLFLFENPLFTRAAFLKAKGTASDLETLLKVKWVRPDQRGTYSFSILTKILG